MASRLCRCVAVNRRLLGGVVAVIAVNVLVRMAVRGDGAVLFVVVAVVSAVAELAPRLVVATLCCCARLAVRTASRSCRASGQRECCVQWSVHVRQDDATTSHT
jgi:hypothetical protein